MLSARSGFPEFKEQTVHWESEPHPLFFVLFLGASSNMESPDLVQSAGVLPLRSQHLHCLDSDTTASTQVGRFSKQRINK